MEIKIKCTMKEFAGIIRTCGKCDCDEMCAGCVIGCICGNSCDGIENVADFEIVGDSCNG